MPHQGALVLRTVQLLLTQLRKLILAGAVLLAVLCDKICLTGGGVGVHADTGLHVLAASQVTQTLHLALIVHAAVVAELCRTGLKRTFVRTKLPRVACGLLGLRIVFCCLLLGSLHVGHHAAHLGAHAGAVLVRHLVVPSQPLLRVPGQPLTPL